MQTIKRSSNETSQLTKNQIDFFKKEGCLILRDFLDTPLLETWREQFWTQAGGSFEDKGSWRCWQKYWQSKTNAKVRRFAEHKIHC